MPLSLQTELNMKFFTTSGPVILYAQNAFQPLNPIALRTAKTPKKFSRSNPIALRTAKTL